MWFIILIIHLVEFIPEPDEWQMLSLATDIEVSGLTVLVRTSSLSEQVRIAERQSACEFTGLHVSMCVCLLKHGRQSQSQALAQRVCPASGSPCCRPLCHIPPAGPHRRVSANLPQRTTNPTSCVQQATSPRRSAKTAGEKAIRASKGPGIARLSS